MTQKVKRPTLLTELQPPDLSGNTTMRLALMPAGPLTETQVLEELGTFPYVPYPGTSYACDWRGTPPDEHLHVTLPDGREIDVGAVRSTVAPGDYSGAPWLPPPKAKEKRGKPKRPVPKVGKVGAKKPPPRREWIQRDLPW